MIQNTKDLYFLQVDSLVDLAAQFNQKSHTFVTSLLFALRHSVD